MTLRKESWQLAISGPDGITFRSANPLDNREVAEYMARVFNEVNQRADVRWIVLPAAPLVPTWRLVVRYVGFLACGALIGWGIGRILGVDDTAAALVAAGALLYLAMDVFWSVSLTAAVRRPAQPSADPSGSATAPTGSDRTPERTPGSALPRPSGSEPPDCEPTHRLGPRP